MPSGVGEGGGQGSQYSFALEYDGPPVSCEIPRVVPINLRQIPVAAVVAEVSLSDKLTLPVVQPIAATDSLPKKLTREVKLADSSVSPTSVIENSLESAPKEPDSESSAVSPTSVILLEERENSGKLSGEFSSSGALEFSNGNFLSGDLSDGAAVDDLNLLASSSISHEHSHELFDGARSCSSAVEFSDSFDKSREGSRLFRVPSDSKVSADLSDLNRPDWASNESILSLEYPSSRVSYHRTADCSKELSSDARGNVAHTFQGIESEDGLYEEFSGDAQDSVTATRGPHIRGKKGSCYRCFKGNRFTEKEVCIVCNAKYCCNCVLRSMGSMPEGRKCVTCIGLPIDESKRANLGKSSRMLKRLLNDLEVRQIMKAEKLCEANQLRPEYVSVNGTPLCHEELVLLHCCPNPPKKLKPGNYWYDKVSGLWGKEGQKPSRIITPHLNVGGPIRADASNGNAQVFINGREITKVELRMLQLAGVQCAGNPHFWVNEDGSYQEEGQKNTKGYIWGKAGTKLLCAFLSLPIPSKSSNSSGEQASNLVTRTVLDYIGHGILQKILLVGHSRSGTSTLFKQAKILYKADPFTADECEDIKLVIQTNVYRYLGILLEGRERFEEEYLGEMSKIQDLDSMKSSGNGVGECAYTIGPRLKAFSDWLLKVMVAGNLEAIFPVANREYAPLVEELWRDSAVQATYKRRNELEMLPSVANYFLERAVDILRTDYNPSDLDILHAEGVTSSNGLAHFEFTFPPSVLDDTSNNDVSDPYDYLLRYQLIRVQAGGLGENCKWLEMFEDIGMVIFCVSLTDYDQYSVSPTGTRTNNMVMSKRLFESIVTHPTFEQMDFLLVLNKFDLFEDKVERVPLTTCEWFDDFHPIVSQYRTKGNSINSNPSLGQLGSHYIAVKFKRLYYSLTGRKLYASVVKGLDPGSVDSALKYAREILKWEEERVNFGFAGYSMYNTEASSFSH
ncbi:hypothetical protein SAY87_020402 [Trapa incisa]|uniref:Extra-large guanine nucleotide-binding protein 1 n=1 Tax=Trapa incisa TaxID=236973 RepID=A0AAN7K3G3_9MYRT|nr:hypothetical protein SAY87_020402 [Trapa incisa]